MTSYSGINYGTKDSNRDPETGIRYGIIPVGLVGQAWGDCSEPAYGDPLCPYCGHVVQGREEHTCVNCHKELKDTDWDEEEPVSWTYKKEGYLLESDSNGDIWVFKSPYYTYAQFCSPCAPGACYLAEPLDEPNEENKCYCLGADWFEYEDVPYPVHSVEVTGDKTRAG